jgi:hypothetical protein
VPEVTRRIGSIAVVVQVNFLAFKSTHEPFRERIVVRVSRAAHADSYAVATQYFDVFSGAVLDAAVGMMHQRGWRGTISQSSAQCFDGKFRLQSVVQSPANHPPGIGIQNDCQVEK